MGIMRIERKEQKAHNTIGLLEIWRRLCDNWNRILQRHLCMYSIRKANHLVNEREVCRHVDFITELQPVSYPRKI